MAWQTPKTDWTSADGVSDADMNRIEGNIQALAGTDNKSTIERKALDIPVDTRSVEVTRTSGQISSLAIKDPLDVSTVASASITRTSGQISSITVTVGTRTITVTVNRTSGQVTSITKAVS